MSFAAIPSNHHHSTRPRLSYINNMYLTLPKSSIPASFGFKDSRKFNGFATFIRLDLVRQTTKRPKLLCAMDMTAGGSEEPRKLNLEIIISRARKFWENAPEPVKSFPWNRALDTFIQLILDLVLTVVKYLYVPVIAVTTISELSYCAHERKLYVILIPLLLGAAVAGVLKEAALESSPSLQNAEVPWHLIAITVFFTLLKLPGPHYPYWVRIFLPHLANGALLRTLWFAAMWSRRRRDEVGNLGGYDFH